MNVQCIEVSGYCKYDGRDYGRYYQYTLHVMENSEAYLLIDDGDGFKSLVCGSCCLREDEANAVHMAAQAAGVKTIFTLGKHGFLNKFVEPVFLSIEQVIGHKDLEKLYKEVLDPFYNPTKPPRRLGKHPYPDPSPRDG